MSAAGKKKRLENLKSLRDRPLEERKKIARLGGIASGEAKRKKSSFKEIAQSILSMRPSRATIEKFKTKFPDLNFEEITVKALMVAGLADKAISGDSAAFNAIKGVVGEEAPSVKGTSSAEKVDFDTFCKNASYPVAYAKQKEFIEFSFAGGFRMVEAARGYGKTDYIAILGAAYEIFKDNSKTFVVISKDRDKASVIVAEIGRCLKANGIELDVDSTRRIKIKGINGKQENAKALSVRMSPKQNHPDFIICDDIVDIKDQYSSAERKYIRDYYEALSGLTENIVFLGQPVFYKDLYSEIKPFLKVMSLPHGTIPELDHDLAARRAAGISKEFIDANYHLKVSALSSCPFAGIGEVDFFPSSTSFMWIDGADTGEDDTSIAVYSENFENCIVAGFCFRKPWYQCMKEIRWIWDTYHAARGGFETNKFGNQPIILLRKDGFNFGGRNTTENKEAKIQNTAVYKENIKLSTFVPTEDIDLIQANKEFNRQVAEYEYKIKGKDDAPDNIASALIYLGKVIMR